MCICCMNARFEEYAPKHNNKKQHKQRQRPSGYEELQLNENSRGVYSSSGGKIFSGDQNKMVMVCNAVWSMNLGEVVAFFIRFVDVHDVM